MVAGRRWFCFGLLMVSVCAFAASPQVERIAALSAPGATDTLRQAVESKGYRVILEDGWSADFWFANQLKSEPHETPGALYPGLSNGEFVGVVAFPKGMTDYRGQAIPAGAYTLRYQLLPQDGNHMGVSPNPDFLLAIPAADDPDPARSYPYKKLVALSSKTTGANHPAVIALDTAGDPGTITREAQGTIVFTVAVPAGNAMKLGIVIAGKAAQ